MLATMALLTSCSSNRLSSTGVFLPPVHQQQLEKSAICCKSYVEMQFFKLTPAVEQPTSLTPESPVFKFATGRSFFAAFELPNGKSRQFTMKTLPVNTLLNQYGHVLIPAVVFLDHRYEPLETLVPAFLARSPVIIGESWGEAILDVPRDARFVVVFDSKSSKGLAWRDSDQRSGFLYVRPGPTGEIRVLANGG